MKTEALLTILENTPIFRDLIKEKHRLLQQGSICRHYSLKDFIFLCIFDGSHFKRWKLKAKLGLNVCYPNSCQIDCDVMQFFHQLLFFCLTLSFWTTITREKKNIHKIINERTKRSNRRAESPILSIMFDWHWYASVVKALRSHYGHKSYHTTWMAPAAIIILHFMPRYTKIWIIINLDLSLEPLLFFFLL